MTVAPPALHAVSSASAKLDARLIAPEAQELAREALAGIAAPSDVGAFAGAVMEGERLASLSFECLAKGYVGWYWVVTLSRVPRSRTATVCETELLPSDAALLSPEWIAWSDRLRPGDLSAGDVLPFQSDDTRLEQGYEATGDEDADQLAIYELGLGRARVLSREGRSLAATRWFNGDGGPGATIAQRTKEQCSTCGFLIPMAGSLRVAFGVCANEWSPSDGRVVTLDHGCGAHSESDVKSRPSEWPDAKAGVGTEFVVSAAEIEVVETRPAAPDLPVGGETAPEGELEPEGEAVAAAPMDESSQEPPVAEGEPEQEPQQAEGESSQEPAVVEGEPELSASAEADSPEEPSERGEPQESAIAD